MSTRTTVVWVPDWPVVAAVRGDEVAPHLPAAVHDGRRLVAVSTLARAQGVRRGMRRRQAQGCCPELVLLAADEGRDVRLFEPVATAVETVVAGIEVARAGLLLLPAGGASRYHGSEEALAERIVTAVAQRTGHEAHVGTADGLLAAILAAREDATVPPGASRDYLAPRGMSELAHAAVQDGLDARVGELVDLLGRLGLRVLGDLAGLPDGDVQARFGRLGAWAQLLARGHDARPPARRRPETDLEVSCELDPPAHRVDIATFMGRRLAEELHALLMEHSVTCGRLQVAARTDEGEDLVRVWRTDTGGLGGLTAARITDRIRWQLEGWLTAGALTRAPEDPEDSHPVSLVRLALTAQDVAPAGAEQGRLWGGASGGDLRAHRALDRVQGLIGGDGVLTAALQGGRDVRDQVSVRPWGDQTAPPRPADRPWPGRLPEPAPATVLVEPEPVEVRTAAGEPVRLDDRFAMSGAPATVRDARGGGRGRAVVGWAGPWPLVERWWAPGARRRAHLQVSLADGGALLLSWQGSWMCEGAYD
ncbi:DNA polymerase Y family protein [Cellulomonas timonensis]|uniref:DNA polymerase Y family protein n=1 Tax=Cellulomonas timonensis TaxID=1689271 RepID=UPI000835F9CE|nr:DNA polymerase Y family protein [Cellulomonas timonensis]